MKKENYLCNWHDKYEHLKFQESCQKNKKYMIKFIKSIKNILKEIF